MTNLPHPPAGLTRLRNYFLTGVIVVAPLAITVWLIWTFVQWVDSWVIPYIPVVYNPETYLPFDIPGVGLLIAIVGITAIGFLTANIIGRTVVGYGERLLGRMPVVRSLYNGLKQIFETVLSNSNTTFNTCGLIEYPRKGIWALVFVATDTKGEVNTVLQRAGHETMSVFLATTPNPTSGFLLFVPKKDVLLLDMSIEDGAKLIISAGLVTPEETQSKLAALAKRGRRVREGEAVDQAPATPPEPGPEPKAKPRKAASAAKPRAKAKATRPQSA
jgi:uncharacterized membrane protein